MVWTMTQVMALLWWFSKSKIDAFTEKMEMVRLTGLPTTPTFWNKLADELEDLNRELDIAWSWKAGGGLPTTVTLFLCVVSMFLGAIGVVVTLGTDDVILCAVCVWAMGAAGFGVARNLYEASMLTSLCVDIQSRALSFATGEASLIQDEAREAHDRFLRRASVRPMGAKVGGVLVTQELVISLTVKALVYTPTVFAVVWKHRRD